ncbi:MAG: hypothetical protein HY554_07500 [Elusimicrobia bacterium]|nr:hypothetical protein [Elusimicrobiota bacterium]
MKPEFWESEKMGRRGLLARLSFIGLVSQADDDGRGRGDPEFLRTRLHPYDPSVTPEAFKAALEELASVGLVRLYRVGGCSYYALPGWAEHQVINRPSKSKLPTPPGVLTDHSVSPPVGVTEDSVAEQGAGNREQGVAPSPPDSEPPEPIVLTFTTTGPVREWHLTQPKLDEYGRTYPHLDVLAEAKKARQWCEDNPAKRKTARGMPAFLNRWLARAQDDSGIRRQASPAPSLKADIEASRAAVAHARSL